MRQISTTIALTVFAASLKLEVECKKDSSIAVAVDRPTGDLIW